MVEALKSKIPVVIPLLKKHKVKRAYAFGSAVTGSFGTDSDIDILIAQIAILTFLSHLMIRSTR